MKIVSFASLSKPKKHKKARIYCVGKVFKPTMLVMSFLLAILLANLFVSNFFAYISLTFKNFVESFVNLF